MLDVVGQSDRIALPLLDVVGQSDRIAHPLLCVVCQSDRTYPQSVTLGTSSMTPTSKNKSGLVKIPVHFNVY